MANRSHLAGIFAGLFCALPLAQAATPNYIEAWRFLNLGGLTGFTGIYPVDIDGDGSLEFVAGIGNIGTWGIGGYDPATQAYNLLWRYDHDAGGQAQRVFRLFETGNTRYVWSGFADGHIEIFDLQTRTLIANLQTGSSPVADVVLADGNNDGVEDAVVLTEDGVMLYDPLTFAVRVPKIAQPQAGRLVVGDVAGDARREIVISNGHVIRIDGATMTPVFTAANIFGGELNLANFDADAWLELTAHDNDGGGAVIRVWDLDGTPAVKWTRNAFIMNHHHVQDLFGDATPELVYSTDLGVRVLEAATGTELWTYQGFCCGTTDFAIYDADGDGEKELLIGAGWQGPAGNFFAVDFATRTLEFMSSPLTGLFTAIDVGDVDNDGKAEIVAVSSNSGGGGYSGIISVYDAGTHALEWRSDASFVWDPIYTFTFYVSAARIANLDADPQAEIILSGVTGIDDRIFVIDGLTHAVEGQWGFDMGSVFTGLDVADVDGDGLPEILVSNVDGGTNYPGHRVSVVNPRTGTRWFTPIAGSSTSSRAYFTDIGATGNDLLAVNGVVTRVRWSDKQQLASAAGNYRSAAAIDVAGSAQNEVAAGRIDGSIDLLDGETLAVLDTYAVPACAGAPIAALLDHGGKTAAAVCDDTLVIYDFAARQAVNQAPVDMPNSGSNGALRRFTLANRTHLLIGGNGLVDLVDGAVNRVPVIPAGGFSVHWRGSADYTLGASDADGDPLTYSISGLPTLGVASLPGATPGVLHYAAHGTAKGSDSVGITVEDGTASASRNIAVSLTNTAPAASTSAVTFHWRGAQSARLAVSDANGDPLVIRSVTAPAHGALTITDAAAGDIRFTPAGAFVGSDTFAYDAFDGADASAARTVQVSLTNTLPQAGTDSLSLHWRGVQAAHLTSSDADGDPLTVRLGAAPARGTLTLTNAANGDVSFAPSGAFVGTDTFTYDAFDGAQASASRTVQLTLTNLAPAAPSALTRDVTVGISVSATLASTDPDGDPVSYVVVSQPARGNLSLNASTGQLDYIPAVGTGDVTATVAASDGVSQSAAATLTFRYPTATPPPSNPPGSSSGGGKKGGGALDWLTLLAGFAAFAMASYSGRRRHRAG
jgi:Big-like domain-containing protein